MITIRFFAVLCAASLPFVSFAQSPDSAYCDALIQRFHRYVIKPSGNSPNPGSLDGNVAVEQCRAGNTAAGIPVLEQKLRSNGVELPTRARAG
jgi:hypothetical protein